MSSKQKKTKKHFNATGLCKYNYWFYVENGAVRFKNTLCKYNGTWWYKITEL